MARAPDVPPGTLTAKGIGGWLSVDEHAVTFHRKGFTAYAQMGGMAGEKRIPLASITSVQFKRAGRVTNGYIQFGVAGGNEARGGLKKAQQDENSLMFVGSHLADFEAIRAFVESRIGRAGPAGSVSRDVAEQLRDLATLRDDGVIDDAEFQRLKSNLLPPA